MYLNYFNTKTKTRRSIFLLFITVFIFSFYAKSQISPVLTVPQGHKGLVRYCYFTPDDNYLISIDDDHVLCIWDGTDGRQIYTLRDSSSSFRKLEINNISTHISALTDSGRLYSIDFKHLKTKVISDSVLDFSMNKTIGTIFYVTQRGMINQYNFQNNSINPVKHNKSLKPTNIVAISETSMAIQDINKGVLLINTINGLDYPVGGKLSFYLTLKDYHPSGYLLCVFPGNNSTTIFRIPAKNPLVTEKIELKEKYLSFDCAFTSDPSKIIITKQSETIDDSWEMSSPALYSFKTGKIIDTVDLGTEYVPELSEMNMNISKRNLIARKVLGFEYEIFLRYDLSQNTVFSVLGRKFEGGNYLKIACANKSKKIAVFNKEVLLPVIYSEGKIDTNKVNEIKKYSDLKINFSNSAFATGDNKSEKKFGFLLSNETAINDSTIFSSKDIIDSSSGYYSFSLASIYRFRNGIVSDSLNFPYHKMAQTFFNSSYLCWSFNNKFYAFDIQSLKVSDSIIYKPEVTIGDLRQTGLSVIIQKSPGTYSDIYDFVHKVKLDTSFIEMGSMLKPINDINYSHRFEGMWQDLTVKDYDYQNNTIWEYPFRYNQIDSVVVFDSVGDIASVQAVQLVPYLKITNPADSTQWYARDIADKINQMPVQQVRAWDNDTYLILTRSNKLFLYSYRLDSVIKEISCASNQYSQLFIRNKKIIVSNENKNDTYIIDIEESKILSHLNGFFNPDINQTTGMLVLQDAAFGNFYIYNANTYQFISTITPFSKTDYIVNTSSGLFDGTDKAIENLYFLYNDITDNKKPWKTIDLTQLKAKYYIPGLWNKIITGDSADLPDVESIKNISLSPGIITDDTFSFKKPYNITLIDRGGGIGTVRILINGKEVIADARNNNTVINKKITLAIDLNPYKKYFEGGSNSIQVFCSNTDSSLTSRGIILSAPDENIKQANPKLFVISIGTSDYKGAEIDLQYSSKDAIDIASALKTGAKNLFSADSTFTYLLTSNSSDSALLPSKQNIERVFRDISSKAEAKDILVLYLSGHGINASGDFYYLTKDAYTANSSAYVFQEVLQAVAISSNEFTEYLKKIAALKQLVIIDACASGKLVENLIAHRDIPFSTLKALDRLKDRTGTHIITGCAADAVSYEASRFGQGLLTYSLLEGMKGASLRENRFLDVVQWFQYARERVPQLAAGLGGIQTPQMYSPSGNQSFDIAELNEEEKKMVPLASEKPVIIQSLFQEEENFTDLLSVGRQLDSFLYQVSSQNTKNSFLFFPVSEFPNAYQILGRYKMHNNEINAIIKIVKIENPDQVITFSITAADVKSLTQLISGKLTDLK